EEIGIAVSWPLRNRGARNSDRTLRLSWQIAPDRDYVLESRHLVRLGHVEWNRDILWRNLKAASRDSSTPLGMTRPCGRNSRRAHRRFFHARDGTGPLERMDNCADALAR